MTTKAKDKERDAESTPVFDELQQRRRVREPRERQHPALFGKDGVEVAERTTDTDTESTDQFTKDFVTLRRDYDTEKDAVHERNVNAVRQYMVNLGLRPGADVVFEGEHDHPDGVSVILRYGVPAVPAVVATSFDQRHAIIPQTGETATDRAEHDAKRVDRLRLGHNAAREGTPEAEQPKAAKERQEQTAKVRAEQEKAAKAESKKDEESEEK